MVLATRFEYGKRANLWKRSQNSQYVPAPNFGDTGMSHNRFDVLWYNMVWSHQPEQRPDEMSSKRYRWKHVDGFVSCFNEYRAASFNPSGRICVDEAMVRWYGQGEFWINHGLPHYVAIDRKPEDGTEI
jgi:hypothetical protein